MFPSQVENLEQEAELLSWTCRLLASVEWALPFLWRFTALQKWIHKQLHTEHSSGRRKIWALPKLTWKLLFYKPYRGSWRCDWSCNKKIRFCISPQLFHLLNLVPRSPLFMLQHVDLMNSSPSIHNLTAIMISSKVGATKQKSLRVQNCCLPHTGVIQLQLCLLLSHSWHERRELPSAFWSKLIWGPNWGMEGLTAGSSTFLVVYCLWFIPAAPNITSDLHQRFCQETQESGFYNSQRSVTPRMRFKGNLKSLSISLRKCAKMQSTLLDQYSNIRYFCKS